MKKKYATYQKGVQKGVRFIFALQHDDPRTVFPRSGMLRPLPLSRFSTAVSKTENTRLREKYPDEVPFGQGLIDTEDRREAIKAFLEMRKPTFHEK